MEDKGTKAQAEGKQDLVENQSSASPTDPYGKRPYERLVENLTFASAPAAPPASGTKTEAEGAKRPCVETRMPHHTVMDETEEEEEEEQFDYGEDWTQDGGYYLRFEGDRVVIVGERPKPVRRSLGRPPPNVLTNKRLTRRLAETGCGFLRADDPYCNIPWNPFPFPIPKEGLSFSGSDTEA